MFTRRCTHMQSAHATNEICRGGKKGLNEGRGEFRPGSVPEADEASVYVGSTVRAGRTVRHPSPSSAQAQELGLCAAALSYGEGQAVAREKNGLSLFRFRGRRIANAFAYGWVSR